MTPSERSANRPGDFRAWIWVAGAAGALAAAVLLTPAPLWLAYMAILALGWGLPGLLLAWLWELPGVDLPAFLLVAFGLGLGWLIAGALLIHHFPGPIAGWANPAEGAGAVVLLTINAVPHVSCPGRCADVALGLILLALTAPRLPGLGYHEFHADEAVLLRQAGRAVSGQDGALAENYREPTGEIRGDADRLPGAGHSRRDPRLPATALMSVGSVLATAWLGRRLFSPHAGAVGRRPAGDERLCWSVARIAQYQPAVLLFRRWLCGRCGSSPPAGRGALAGAAAAWSAVGLIMHYEFGLLAPALLYLAWRGWAPRRDASPGATQPGGNRRRGGKLGALVVAAYLPVAASPISRRRRAISATAWARSARSICLFSWEMGTFYNSTYYFMAWRCWRRRSCAALGLRQNVQIALLTLWWLPFFVLYIFIIRAIRARFYLLMESWSLLAALPRASRHRRRRPLARRCVGSPRR